MNFDKITNAIKLFNPKIFFEWINVVATHPLNQKYLMRFEFILAIFFTIPPKDFKSQKVTREDIYSFFNDFDDDLDRIFIQMEDFTPFDQLKQLPIFINSKKYYFFYGLIENPYTRWNTFSDFLFSVKNEKKSTLKNIQKKTLCSLQQQTIILNSITKFFDKTSLENSNQIFIPSNSYYSKVSRSFIVSTNNEKFNGSFCTLGFLKKYGHNLLETCYNAEIPYLFHSLTAKIENQFYTFLPHIHLENLSYHAIRKINNSKNIKIWDQLDLNFRRRILKSSLNFFSLHYLVQAIYASSNDEIDLLVKYNIASCFLFDSNKLMVFHASPYKENETIPKKVIKQTIDAFHTELGSSHELGIFTEGINHPIVLDSNNLEIWHILIDECIKFNSFSTKMLDENSSINLHLVEFGDLKFMFEVLFKYKNEAPIYFLKYLQNDQSANKETSFTITTNYLDKFACYVNGENFYLKAGQVPNFLMYTPFDGNSFECEFYEKKFSDNIYELVELHFPNYFNFIDQIYKHTYQAVNTGFRETLYILKLDKDPIFVFPPKAPMELTKIDIELTVKMLPQLFCYHLGNFAKNFAILLEEHEIQINKYSLLITSNIAQRESKNRIPFLDQYLPLLSKENPIIIKTLSLPDNRTRSFILVNSDENESLINLFKVNDNSGEKYCLDLLVRSILEHSNCANPNMESKNFVNINLPHGKKCFVFGEFQTKNPELDKYSQYIKITNSDIAKANKLFAEYISGSEIEPGEYISEDAKKINCKIYDFLQDLLENELSKFDNQTILFAYKQLELVEGMKERKKLQHGLSKTHTLEYDLNKKVREDTEKLLLVSAEIKHCIHSILKVNPSGQKRITASDWSYLLGIIAALMETAQIYEYIHYDLSPHKLVITDIFEIYSEKISDKVNHDKWIDDIAKAQLYNASKAYTNATNNNNVKKTRKNEPESPSKFTQSFEELDKEYLLSHGYSLRSRLDIYYALYLSNNHSKSPLFPLSIVSKDELIETIHGIIKYIDKDEVSKIIDATCLTFSKFADSDKLIPSELLTRKNRLNLNPIIRLDSNRYIYGNQFCNFSFNIWWNEIEDGDFPYKVDNPKILKHLSNIHNLNSKELEVEAEKKLQNVLIKKHVKRSLKKFNEISSCFPKDAPCGEIDIVCINPNNQTIFVLEAKSLFQKNRPIKIKQSFRDFFDDTNKKKRYYFKLNKKYEFVRDNLGYFIDYFGCDNKIDWKIKKAFIVDKTIFAAYHTEYEVDFIHIQDLVAFIQKD